MTVQDVLDFDAWYLAQHARMVTVLAATTGDADLASEVADEAFSRAYERWDRVGPMNSPTGWVYTTALNEARRRGRRRAVERRLWLRRADPSDLPGPTGEIWQLVGALPRRQREAVVLRHVGHMTEAEAAAVMSVSRGTVSSTLRDAYRRLESQISEVLDPTIGVHSDEET